MKGSSLLVCARPIDPRRALLVHGRLWLACIVAFLVSASATAGAVRFDPSAGTWTLTSGPVEYRLQRDGDHIRLAWFGPARRSVPWRATDVGGRWKAKSWAGRI